MWGNFGKSCKYRKDIVLCFYLMSQMFYVMYQCGVLSFFYRCASFILNGLQYPFVVGLDMEQIFCYIERKALPE